MQLKTIVLCFSALAGFAIAGPVPAAEPVAIAEAMPAAEPIAEPVAEPVADVLNPLVRISDLQERTGLSMS